MEEQNTEIKRAAPAASPAPMQNSAPNQDGRPPFHRRRFEVRKKVCRLCADKVDKITYKNVQVLKTFMMDSGKIIARRMSGACAKHQRQLATAIKRARIMLLVR